SPSVCVTIVTYNSREFIEPCLQSVFKQDYGPVEVIVVDNGSVDGTKEILHRFSDGIAIIYNDRNAGFAAAQNQAIAASNSEWVLVLNPDVVLLPGFIGHLVAGGSM